MDANGLIPVEAFYHYLTVWYNADPFAYTTSQANFAPTPPEWQSARGRNIVIPRAADIVYAQQPYFLNGELSLSRKEFREKIFSRKILRKRKTPDTLVPLRRRRGQPRRVTSPP